MIIKRLALAASIVALTSTNLIAGVVTVHGSTTVKSNVFDVFESELEAETGHELTVVGNGSSNGLLSLDRGLADVGMISAPLEMTAKKAAKKSADFSGDGFMAHQVGEARVAFIRHPSNPVQELTLEQIGQILSGSITNWSELGGKPMPILVILEQPGGGLRSMAEAATVGDEPISAQTREVPNGPQIAKIVAQVPNALGISAAVQVSEATPEIKTDESIAQPLILVTRGEPTPEVATLIASIRKHTE